MLFRSYSFTGYAGTEIWITFDQTSFSLDTFVELIDADGNVVASSDNWRDELKDASLLAGGNLSQSNSDWGFEDYYSINPLGYVPLLVLDDGRQLREGPAIVQYIADQAPEKQLAPVAGSFERYKLQEWLTFIGTELHKGFSPLFTPGMPEEVKTAALARLGARLQWVEGELAERPYLMGQQFSVADAYLFTVVGWSRLVRLDISALPRLGEFMARMRARPAVQAALRAEGLLN